MFVRSRHDYIVTGVLIEKNVLFIVVATSWVKHLPIQISQSDDPMLNTYKLTNKLPKVMFDFHQQVSCLFQSYIHLFPFKLHLALNYDKYFVQDL
jgi:hypothetical protein